MAGNKGNKGKGGNGKGTFNILSMIRNQNAPKLDKAEFVTEVQQINPMEIEKLDLAANRKNPSIKVKMGENSITMTERSANQMGSAMAGLALTAYHTTYQDPDNAANVKAVIMNAVDVTTTVAIKKALAAKAPKRTSAAQNLLALADDSGPPSRRSIGWTPQNGDGRVGWTLHNVD